MKIQQLSKKFKKSQSGRSMVEMLGVLAIIGVLSIGGVAGYRMAMLKIFENDVRNLFARIYQGVQSSMMNPNTYLNCCSGNITGTYYNACSSDSGTWYTEQYDEICSYLSPDDCKTRFVYETVGVMKTKSDVVWQYLALNYTSNMFMISLSFQGLGNKYSPETLSNVCENVLTDIVSNPVYREKLVGIGKYRFLSYPLQKITQANVHSVCAVNEFNYVAISIYFENDNLVNCIADEEE